MFETHPSVIWFDIKSWFKKHSPKKLAQALHDETALLLYKARRDAENAKLVLARSEASIKHYEETLKTLVQEQTL